MKAVKLLLLCLLLLAVSGGLLSANAALPGAASASTPNNRDLAVSAERGEQIGRAYLQQNATNLGLTAADVSHLRVTDNYAARISGARYVYFQQEVNGIGIHNAVLNLTILPNGEVLFVGNRGQNQAQQRVNSASPTLSAAEAVYSAATHLQLTFNSDLRAIATIGGTEAAVTFAGGDLSLDAIPVKLAYQPIGDDLRLAWDMNIHQTDGQHWWHIRIDATTGELLDKGDWMVQENWEQQRTESGHALTTSATTGAVAAIVSDAPSFTSAFAPMSPDSYKVYPIPVESPNHTTPAPPADGRVVVTNPANSTASPFGWHDTNGATGAEFTTTRGNNVYAYTDVDDDDEPDPNSSPDGGAGLNFNFPINLNQDPSQFKPASVTNWSEPVI